MSEDVGEKDPLVHEKEISISSREVFMRLQQNVIIISIHADAFTYIAFLTHTVRRRFVPLRSSQSEFQHERGEKGKGIHF